MLQVKLCEGSNISQLEKAINEALLDIQSEVNIVYDLGNMAAAIQYNKGIDVSNCICCECQHWDSSSSTSDVMGLCHRKGQRKRFNATACNEYSDIRD